MAGMPDSGIVAYPKSGSGTYAYDGWGWSVDGRLSEQKMLGGGDTYDFDRVVTATGVLHWKRVDGHWWVPDLKGKSTARPCCVRVNRGDSRWSQYGPCGKPIKEDGKCGMHNRQIAKQAEAEQAYKDKRARSDAGSRIAKDAVEALGARGIPAVVNYESGYKASDFHGYDGRVKIHAEDLLALLRKIEHLEQGL